MKKFFVKTDLLTYELKAETYNDAIQEMYDEGFVNCGVVQLLETEYKEICCTPHLVNTDYWEDSYE